MPSQAAARLPDVLTLGYGHTESMCAAPSLQFGPVNPALYQLGPLGASCLNTDYLWCFLGCSWIFRRSSSCSAVQVISVGLEKKKLWVLVLEIPCHLLLPQPGSQIKQQPFCCHIQSSNLYANLIFTNLCSCTCLFNFIPELMAGKYPGEAAD